MFNSTADRLHHLRVTWHSFASILCLLKKSARSVAFPEREKNRRRLPRDNQPPSPSRLSRFTLSFTRQRASAASEGLNGYGASTFGTRCREIIDPLRPPSPSATPHVSLALNERLHSHVSPRAMSACMKIAGERMEKGEKGKERNLERRWNDPGPIPVNFARREPTSGVRVVLRSLSRLGKSFRSDR